MPPTFSFDCEIGPVLESSGEVLSTCVSKNGEYVASVTREKGGRVDQLKIWDVATNTCKTEVDLPNGTVAAIEFSDDSLSLAYAGQLIAKHQIAISKEGESEQMIFGTLPSEKIEHLAFSEKFNKVALANKGKIHVFQPFEGTYETIGLDSDIETFSLSPNGRFLAFGNNELSIWDFTNKQICSTVKVSDDSLPGSPRSWVNPRQVAFSQDGQVLVTVCKSLVQAWETTSGKKLLSWQPQERDAEWVTKNKEHQATLRKQGGLPEPRSVAISRDGKKIAIGTISKFKYRVDVVDLRNSKVELTIPPTWVGEFQDVGAISFSPDGRKLAISCSQESKHLGYNPHRVLMKVYDLQTAKQLCQRVTNKSRQRRSNPYGMQQYKISFCEEGDKVIYRIPSSQQVFDIQFKDQKYSLEKINTLNSSAISTFHSFGELKSIQFSPSYAIRLMDIASAKSQDLVEHSSPVRWLEFENDRLISAGQDQVCVWDLTSKRITLSKKLKAKSDEAKSLMELHRKNSSSKKNEIVSYNFLPKDFSNPTLTNGPRLTKIEQPKKTYDYRSGFPKPFRGKISSWHPALHPEIQSPCLQLVKIYKELHDDSSLDSLLKKYPGLKKGPTGNESVLLAGLARAKTEAGKSRLEVAYRLNGIPSAYSNARPPDAKLRNVVNAAYALGNYYKETGSENKARKFWRDELPLFRSSLTESQNFYGKMHPDLIQRKVRLGDVLHSVEEYAEAEQIFQECLTCCLTFLGNDHPQTQEIRNRQIKVYKELGLFSSAFETMKSERKASRQYLVGILPLFTFLDQQKFLRKQEAGQFNAAMQLAHGLNQHPSFADISAEWAVNSKGLGTLITKRRLSLENTESSERLPSLVKSLRATRIQLSDPRDATASKVGIQETTNTIESFQAMRQKRTALVKEIASIVDPNVNSTEEWIELRKLKNDLNAQTALVHVAKWKDSESQGHYSAWLIARDKNSQYFYLGEATEIDAAIDDFREAVAYQLGIRSRKWGNIEDLKDPPELKKISNILLKPFGDSLSGYSKLVFSPDEKTWFVPWHALMIKGQSTYLVEHHAVSYCTSAKSLIRPEKR